jgi:hypothetical protein
MKFEYMEERVHGRIDVDRLNSLGEQGWELCAVTPAESSLLLVYKRRKPAHV